MTTATATRTRRTKATAMTAVSATGPTAGKPGRGRRKATGNTGEAPVVSDDEKALVAKYGATHTIIPGSLRYAGGREGWGQKRTVEIRCKACEVGIRVVASSDLQWPTTAYDLVCVKDVKANQRRTKAEKKSQ